MEYPKIIARIYEHLEADSVEGAVMGCLRLSRNLKDYIWSAIFLRELYPNKDEVARALYDDILHLKPEAQKFIFEHSLERWIESHAMDFDITGDPHGDRNILSVAVGQIESELTQWERSIADLTLPNGMDPFDIAAFTDRHANAKAQMRFRIQALHTVKSRVKARCLNYAIRIERQLSAQNAPENFLSNIQTEVNNYFRSKSEDIYCKLQKSSELILSKDREDSSLLLTEVRRALKAVSDFFYPPVSGLVMCTDGKERLLGNDQYLNRLQEFLTRNVSQSAAREILHDELDYLSRYVRRINEIASKGVHADVTFAEAKQGLVALYFFLYNILQYTQVEPE